MRYLAFFISIFFLLVINLSVFGILPIRGHLPNLIFLFSLCAALGKKEFDVFFIAFFGGLWLDFFSAGFFGGQTFALLCVSLSVFLFANYMFAAELNFKTLGFSLIFAWAMFCLINWLWQLAAAKLNLAPNYLDFKLISQNFIFSLIYNLLLLYPVYLFYDFVKRRLDNYEIKSRGVIQ